MESRWRSDQEAPRPESEPPCSDLTGEYDEVLVTQPARYGSSTASEPSRQGMFMDIEAMKAKIRLAMTRPEYDVRDLYHEAGWCQMVARSGWFEKATLSVIAFNALWIAIDTDMNKAAVLIDAHPVFQIAEHGFCVYFAWEWVMRFFAFRRKRDGLRDAWFVFDSGMVFIMVAETWAMSAALLAMDSASGGLGGNTGTLRLLRLLRLSRMARMAKLLRRFPELLILIKGMASAMRSVIVTLFLLALLIYVFAIAFRQLTDGTPAGVAKFPDMWMAMHTLWIDGTLLDSTGDVVSMLLEESVIYALLFYVFVLLSALTVMNMLIGVLCEVVSAVAATEREQIAVATVKDGFMGIIARGGIDKDGDSMISRQEFVEILDNPDAVHLLSKVDVDVYALVDLADFIFQAEDHGAEVQMAFPDFMETVLSLRGSNVATVKDITDLRQFVKKEFGTSDSKNEARNADMTRTFSEQLWQWQDSACPERGVSSPRWEQQERAPAERPRPLLAVPQGDRGPGDGAAADARQMRAWALEAETVLAAMRQRAEVLFCAAPGPECSVGSAQAAALVAGAGAVAVQHQLSLSATVPVPSLAALPLAASPPGAGWSPRQQPLPGMVRRATLATCPEADASPLDTPRLADIRSCWQRLDHALAIGLEELHAIQELF